MAVISLEGSSWLAEGVLARQRGIAYEPMPRQGLNHQQREIIDFMLAGRSTYYTHCPDTGWTIKPDGTNALYSANSQGLRGNRDYASRPQKGVTRIACFGDSFTHGDEVANEHVWTALLDESSSAVEVLNFGVGGYGVDQAYLRYVQEGVAFNPDVVLIGFMTRNIKRHVNVFRPFVRAHTSMPLAKPRFQLQGEELSLLPNPLNELDDYRRLLEDTHATLDEMSPYDYHARHVYHASRWDVLASVRLAKLTRSLLVEGDEWIKDGLFDRSSEPYAVTRALLEMFADRVAETGAEPIIVLFPDGSDLERLRDGEPLPYDPLRDDLLAGGYRVIDLREAFREAVATVPPAELCPSHYSELGNRLVKDHILGELDTFGLLPVPSASCGMDPVIASALHRL